MKRKDLKRGDFFHYPSTPSLKFMVPWDVEGNPDYALPEGFNLSHPTRSDMESDVIQIDVFGRPIYRVSIGGQEPVRTGGSEEASPGGLGNISPAHYQSLTPEPIDVIESWGLNFRLANVVKYIARAGNKPGVDRLDDLRKARQYLNREIATQEGRRAWE